MNILNFCLFYFSQFVILYLTKKSYANWLYIVINIVCSAHCGCLKKIYEIQEFLIKILNLNEKNIISSKYDDINLPKKHNMWRLVKRQTLHYIKYNYIKSNLLMWSSWLSNNLVLTATLQFPFAEYFSQIEPWLNSHLSLAANLPFGDL